MDIAKDVFEVAVSGEPGRVTERKASEAGSLAPASSLGRGAPRRSRRQFRAKSSCSDAVTAMLPREIVSSCARASGESSSMPAWRPGRYLRSQE